jgi:hypothetical protein
MYERSSPNLLTSLTLARPLSAILVNVCMTYGDEPVTDVVQDVAAGDVSSATDTSYCHIETQ